MEKFTNYLSILNQFCKKQLEFIRHTLICFSKISTIGRDILTIFVEFNVFTKKSTVFYKSFNSQMEEFFMTTKGKLFFMFAVFSLATLVLFSNFGDGKILNGTFASVDDSLTGESNVEIKVHATVTRNFEYLDLPSVSKINESFNIDDEKNPEKTEIEKEKSDQNETTVESEKEEETPRNEQTKQEEITVVQKEDEIEKKEENTEEQPKETAQEETPQKEETPQTTPTIPSYELSDFEWEVVQLTNAEREKQGLPKLQVDSSLSYVAKKKSEDMVTNQYFAHNSPVYGSVFDMLNEFGIYYTYAGENLAYGYATPESVVSAWMNSEGHRKNILNTNYTHIGVGYVKEGHYWTMHLIRK